MSVLKEKYEKEFKKALKEELGIKNVHQVPKLVKIIVSAGFAKKYGGTKDALPQLTYEFNQITGQKPIIRNAKKSISNFKLREGYPVGLQVTLRGKRMYDFAYKLINIDLPRVSDFRGVPTKTDGRGNYTFGLRTQSNFSEVNLDTMAYTQGMNITFVTTATSEDECIALLKKFGMPFKKADA